MKGFSDTLRSMRGGQADVDAGAAIGELIRAVRETGRGGSVLIEVRVTPVNKGSGDQVLVEDVVKLKAPKAKKAATVFFTDDSNALQTRDPRQPELAGLREVTRMDDRRLATGSKESGQ